MRFFRLFFRNLDFVRPRNPLFCWKYHEEQFHYGNQSLKTQSSWLKSDSKIWREFALNFVILTMIFWYFVRISLNHPLISSSEVIKALYRPYTLISLIIHKIDAFFSTFFSKSWLCAVKIYVIMLEMLRGTIPLRKSEPENAVFLVEI